VANFFSFPNPVNDVAARTVAGGVIVMAAVAVATHQLWLTIPLAYGFVARVACGPRFSPLGRIATEVVAPVIGKNARRVPGPPKRFAQAMGAAFTLSALIAWAIGNAGAAEILLGVLLVPATLEAVFGYCVGCQIFSIGMRLGIVPERICVECADIYGAGAAARRSQRRAEHAA
jgi:hypothetical protein